MPNDTSGCQNRSISVKDMGVINFIDFTECIANFTDLQCKLREGKIDFEEEESK